MDAHRPDRILRLEPYPATRATGADEISDMHAAWVHLENPPARVLRHGGLHRLGRHLHTRSEVNENDDEHARGAATRVRSASAEKSGRAPLHSGRRGLPAGHPAAAHLSAPDIGPCEARGKDLRVLDT